VSTIDPSAVHEAGHVIVALCGRLNIAGVVVNERVYTPPVVCSIPRALLLCQYML
jgi:hypothetical protein